MAFEIEFITDDRFHGGTCKKLIAMDIELKNNISKLRGVRLDTLRELYHITFHGEKEGDTHTNQWRTTYRISKNTNKIKWNEVFGIINKIYAPYYKRVKN